MSGVSFGLIVLASFAVRAVASQSTASASKKASYASTNKANTYEQVNRMQRPYVSYYSNYQYDSGKNNNYTAQRQNINAQRQPESYSDNLGNLRNDIQNNMNQQLELNRKASDEMMNEIEAVRAEMKAAAEKSLEDYDEYLGLMKERRQVMFDKITQQQNDVNRQYRDKISESMVQITAELNNKHREYLSELSSLQNNINAKNEKASEIAKSYINEAKSTIKSLIEDFEGEKYVRRELIALNDQMNKAIEQYNKGNYESAIAASKDALIGTVEEIYHADEKKQEWENYYKTALVLSADLRAFTEAQEYVTEPASDLADEEKLNEEMIGKRIADYTGKNSKGIN